VSVWNEPFITASLEDAHEGSEATRSPILMVRTRGKRTLNGWFIEIAGAGEERTLDKRVGEFGFARRCLPAGLK
jgi:hypothetical protein